MKLRRKIFDLIKQTFQEWQEDNVSRLAAALAYYTIFSLAPLLIIAITLAGLIWSRSTVQSQVLLQVQDLIGQNGADFVRSLLQNASINLDNGFFASIIGLGALIFGSIGVFRQLRNTLNSMWGIEPENESGFWKSVKLVLIKNLLSFAMVMGVGFLLIVSLVVSTIVSVMGSILTNIFLLPTFFMGIINTIVTLLIITFVFALLFKYLPETKVAWGDVILGGFVTAVLFLIGKYVIGLYLGKSSIGVTFGAAGSLALLLIWVYYSAQIFFFGAEFTQVYANKFGSKIRASKNASLIETEPHLAGQEIHSSYKNIKKYQPDPEISYIARSQSNVYMKAKRRYAVHKKSSDIFTGVFIISVILAFSFLSKMLLRLSFSNRNG